MITYEWLANTLVELADSINAVYKFIITMLSQTEWLTQILNSSVLDHPKSAIKATAITLCAMFFLMDFFTKTLHLQWVTWENVLMLFLKLIVAKVCVDNAEWIVTTIYNGFSSLITTAFLAENPAETIKIIPTNNKITMASYFWLDETEAGKLFPPANTGFLNFEPLWMATKAETMGTIMVILLCICNVIVIGRIFELVVYTIIAPIPLSTLACEGLQDVGKNFLKSYAAVCIQAIVLIIMFLAYSSIHTFLDDLPLINLVSSWRGLLEILVLALGVMQSGAWAKRICGAM